MFVLHSMISADCIRSYFINIVVVTISEVFNITKRGSTHEDVATLCVLIVVLMLCKYYYLSVFKLIKLNNQALAKEDKSIVESNSID